MTTDITELTQESARESGSILIIVAARMARREFFTPLHALCESGKRVVSTRALCDAVERAEERMVSQVPKIVDGHDRLTKKLKEAESRNAELVEALEKAQQEAEELSKFKEVMTSAEEALKAGSPLNLESLFKGELASAMFAMMLAGEFIRSGATNYLELLYDVPEFGGMTVTLQKVEGKTPGQRIAELESRTVTVKLPDLRQIVSGDRYVWSDGAFNYNQDVKAALTAAGIKWEA